MTIKELADFTGKDIRTLRRWISKVPHDKMSPVPHDKMSQGIANDYSIDEVECIMQAGSMSKDAVSIIMQNARNQKPTNQIVDYEAIGKMIAIAVTTAMEPMIKTIMNNHPLKPEQKQIEYVPEKTQRAIFLQKMNEFSRISGMNNRDAYRYVYDEIGAIYSIRIMARAKHRHCTGVDVLEADMFLGNGIAVIIKLIKALKEGV